MLLMPGKNYKDRNIARMNTIIGSGYKDRVKTSQKCLNYGSRNGIFSVTIGTY